MLDWIGSLLTSLFSALFGFIGQILSWCLQIVVYFIKLLIHDLMFFIQQLILAIIVAANAAIALLPACNVPYIDLTPFSQSINGSGGTVASAICWLLPISFLTIVLGCMVNAVMAYFAISWVLRWLKVIK